MKFPIFGASDDAYGTGTVFQYLNAAFGNDWSATENQRQIPISENITITDFKVMLTTAPGVGKSRTFVIRQNGSDTGVTCTISDANTSGTFSGSVSFTAGDLLSIKHTSSGTPTASGTTYWHMFMMTAGQKYLLMGACGQDAPTGALNYCDPFGDTTWTTGALARDTIVPTTGNLTKLTVALTTTTPGTGKSYACAMRLNNTSDVLTATISDANTSASATGSQALAAGDTLQMKQTPSGTPTAGRLGWCFTFEPTTNGESFYGFGSGSGMSTSATQYEQPIGVGATGWSATESARQLKLPAGTIKNLYVRISGVPGAGTSRTFTLRDNGASSTLTTTIGAAATTGNDTSHSVTHTADQTIGIQSSLTGTPASAHAHLGFVVVTVQPDTALTATSIASGAALGSPTVTNYKALAPPAKASTLTLGAPTLTHSKTLTVTGIASTGGVGTPRVSYPQTLTVPAIAASGGLGTPTVSRTTTLAPPSIVDSLTVKRPIFLFDD